MCAELPAAGQRLQVYWPLDKAWYPGRVLSFTETQGATQVVYDDGDVEMLHLVMERYRLEPSTFQDLFVRSFMSGCWAVVRSSHPEEGLS